MNKYEIYKKNLKEYNNFKENQQELKEKHNITSDKIIVETSNTIKFLITSAKNLLRILVAIVAIAFISIGIITMLYSEIREEFFKVITKAFSQILSWRWERRIKCK